MRKKVHRPLEGEPRPFLKWVGGKGRLLRVLNRYLPPRVDEYHEPFVGGGALYWHLCRTHPPVERVHLGDGNARLMRTYAAVRDEVDVVAELLRRFQREHIVYGRELYEHVRKEDVDAMGGARMAAWMIYINKTCYNGLYRVNGCGVFNVPYGRYADPKILDESNLRACSAALRGARLDCGNACDALSRIERVGPNALVYLDSPYVPTGDGADFDSYTCGGFGAESQRRLAEEAYRVKSLGARVVATNSDTPLVRELYPETRWRVDRVEVRGNALNRDGSKRGKVAELVMS